MYIIRSLRNITLFPIFIMVILYFTGYWNNFGQNLLNYQTLLSKNYSATFLKEQRRRVEHIATICRKEKNSLKPDLKLDNIFIDRENRLTWCPFFKSATTSWMVLFLKLKNKWNGNLKNILSTFKKTLFVAKNEDALKFSEGTFPFLVVRHPFERLVSCYRDKYEGLHNYYYYKLIGEKMVLEFRDVPQNLTNKQNLLKEITGKARVRKPIYLPNNPYANPPGPTFEEFIRYVISSAPDDSHWKTYFSQCPICDIRYKFILRFENLEEESTAFLSYMNLSSKVSLEWKNPTKEGATEFQIVCDYMSRLSADLLLKVEQKYKSDLLLFEYDSEKYISCAQSNI